MTDRPLIEDPEIAANILNLVEQTGIAVEQYMAWLESDPPPGITRSDWLNALTSTSGAPPIPPGVMERLRCIAAPALQAPAA